MFGRTIPKANTPERHRFLQDFVLAQADSGVPMSASVPARSEPHTPEPRPAPRAAETSIDISALKARLQLERLRSEERRAAEQQASEMNAALRAEKRRAYTLDAEPRRPAWGW